MSGSQGPRLLRDPLEKQCAGGRKEKEEKKDVRLGVLGLVHPPQMSQLLELKGVQPGVNCTCSPSFLETKRSQVLLHPLSTHMHTKVSKVYFRLPPLWKIASGVLCMGDRSAWDSSHVSETTPPGSPGSLSASGRPNSGTVCTVRLRPEALRPEALRPVAQHRFFQGSPTAGPVA